MIERAQKVTNIMQQGANDIFLITAILMGAGRGLQAVLQTVNGKAAKITLQHLQMASTRSGRVFEKSPKAAKFFDNFFSAINHGRELRAVSIIKHERLPICKSVPQLHAKGK